MSETAPKCLPSAPKATVTITFVSRDGVPLRDQERYHTQADECRLDDRIAESQYCRTCDEQTELLRNKKPLDKNQECSFRDIRVVCNEGILKTHQTPKTATKYVTDNWVHATSSSIDDDLTILTCDVGGLPSEGAAKEMCDVVLGKICTDIYPLLNAEYQHAAQTKKFVFQELWQSVKFPQCTHCACFMEGSWMCTKCGCELCLTCYKTVTARKDKTQVASDTVFACNKGNEMWNAHQEVAFIARARRTRSQLELQRMVARQGASHFFGRDSGRGLVMQTLWTVVDQAQREIGTGDEHQVPTVYTRRDYEHPSAYVEGKAKLETLVVRAGMETESTARQRRVLQFALATQDAFLVQQDVVKPLSTEGLMGLFGETTAVRLGKVMKDAEDTQTIARDIWTWKEVVTELGKASDDRTTLMLDIRDFPSDEQLLELSPEAVRLFRDACSFPSLGHCRGLNADGIDKNDMRILGDLAPWCVLPERDAREKCYIALPSLDGDEGTTVLHVDEAGAMNVLLWVEERPDDVTEMETDNNPTTEQLNNRPVGAEWTIWPYEARRLFNEAARKANEADEGEQWTGDVLYGQTFNASAEFNRNLAKLGKERGVNCSPYVIMQRVGEAVFIPPGAPHQVRNIRACFKIARDIMPPTGVAQMIAVQSERSAATANGSTKGVDACMIRPVLLWAWRVCVATIAASPWANEAGLDPTTRAILNEMAKDREERADEMRAMARDMEKLAKTMASLTKVVNGMANVRVDDEAMEIKFCEMVRRGVDAMDPRNK